MLLGAPFGVGKGRLLSSAAEQQETLENRLKSQLLQQRTHNSANPHVPKAAAFRDPSTRTTAAAVTPRQCEPLQMLLSKSARSAEIKSDPPARASSPARGQSSAPDVSGYQDLSYTSPGSAANPSSTSQPTLQESTARGIQKAFDSLKQLQQLQAIFQPHLIAF